MRQAYEYILIHDINDSLAVGQTVKRVPLHLTVLSWFVRLSKASEELTASSIQEFTQKLEPITLIGAERSMFGPEFDVPVTILEKSDQITQLHVGLMAVAGAVVNSQYSGADKYSPHVSDTDSCTFRVGQEQLLDRITLVRRTDSSSDREAIAKFTLREREVV